MSNQRGLEDLFKKHLYSRYRKNDRTLPGKPDIVSKNTNCNFYKMCKKRFFHPHIEYNISQLEVANQHSPPQPVIQIFQEKEGRLKVSISSTDSR